MKSLMKPPHECGGFFEDFFRYRVHLLVDLKLSFARLKLPDESKIHLSKTSSFYDSKISLYKEYHLYLDGGFSL